MNYIWQILVPCNYNNGKPVRTRHHREWDRQVRAISGGLTIFSPGKGQWVGKDKKVYFDRIIPVNIICTEKEIKKIAEITLKHYKQLAVTYYKLSSEAYIYEG